MYQAPPHAPPVQCPKCSSYNTSVVGMSPPNARCRCTDCGSVYNYRMREITNGAEDESAAEFAKQWDEAVEYAIDMLHARAFQRALEGDLETVYYMGKPVGYIRKFSDKLQIEMLRAYRPDRFKTPGTNVNIGTRSDVFVLTEEQRAELKAINRQWLLESPIPERGVAQHNVVAQPMPASGALAGAGEERAT